MGFLAHQRWGSTVTTHSREFFFFALTPCLNPLFDPTSSSCDGTDADYKKIGDLFVSLGLKAAGYQYVNMYVLPPKPL
jgi:hypothetical protein